MTPGMEVPVKVSPDDPQRVAVQWDALKAGVVAAGGALAAAQQGLDAISGGQYSAMTGGIPAPGSEFTWPTQAGAAAAGAAGGGATGVAGQTPQEPLAKLDSLMAAGMIDDAEYTANASRSSSRSRP